MVGVLEWMFINLRPRLKLAKGKLLLNFSEPQFLLPHGDNIADSSYGKKLLR